jgi:alpha-L-rhamnosidase
MLMPHSLTCEYSTNPLGLDVRRPRLSWKSSTAVRNARQTAYQIQVAASTADLAAPGRPRAGLLWDTGKVPSDRSLHVPYAGPDLGPGQRCCWRVRLWDGHDVPSEWSETAFWEMGLLASADWQAGWITPDWDEDGQEPGPAPLLRRNFTAGDGIVAARIYATGLGLYELRLNGGRVGDALLTPGWTSYHHWLQYQTYDVTDMVRAGDNALGAMLGDGWYRGHLGFRGERNLYGDRLALLLELHLTYADGRVQIVPSDAGWRATRGPIRMADIYMGETYDATQERPGWDRPGYDDSDWHGVRRLDHAKANLVAQVGPPVRRQEELRPVRKLESPKGETIFDFGQNLVGWVRVRARGPAGTAITLRHAEVLDQAGNLYTDNLRAARQTTRFILKGQTDADEVFEPHFTFQGFRFVAVEGYPGEPALQDFTGIVLHSDMPHTGTFECSSPPINQLQHNIAWGQKGNFVDVPTDCPQRDERLGWTGDAQVFIRTACFNMDVAAFFTKWLRDLRTDQLPDGNVPFVLPDLPFGTTDAGLRIERQRAGSAAWGDAAVICPWTLYLCYGDTRLLEQQYASMAAWVAYVRRRAGEDYIWRGDFHYGDWLDFRGVDERLPAPVTNGELIATAFFAYSAGLLANMAQVLGRTSDAARYADLAREVKAAFTREFVTPAGRVGPDTQTAYVLALHFDLLPEPLRAGAAARLAEAVRQHYFHLTTGFVGTPYLCHVLSRSGYTDVAYELLNQESYPAWLYPVNRGATTIWERWDGIRPDGSFQDPKMNSFNHYAYGAIGDWLYRVVAGIEVDPAEPGYKHVLIRPQPGGGLTYARATLDSPYGVVASGWELTEAGLRVEVSIPPNAHATARLPAASLDMVTEGGQPLRSSDGIRSARMAEGEAVITLGSGTYAFFTAGLNRDQALAGVQHVAGRMDRYSTLRDLLADDAARTVLAQHLGPALLEAPELERMLDVPLAQLADLVPQLLTPDELDEIEAALGDLILPAAPHTDMPDAGPSR